MIVNIEQITNGVKTFIDREIGAKATGFKKFGVYFILPSVDKYVVNIIDKLSHITPEIFDENHNVDFDIVYSHAKSAIQHSGQFQLMGVIFNESDIDKLYTYIVNKEMV